MRLSAGKTYAVKIEYYQGTGAAIIDFYWTKVGADDYFQASLNDVDVVIACFGHDSGSEAEGGDRTFALPSKQKELITKVISKTTTPIVGVLLPVVMWKCNLGYGIWMGCYGHGILGRKVEGFGRDFIR